ncbi:MAG: acyl-CoA dehydrogenase family protein, partial [Acidimicrobiales bacterium]
MDLRPSETAAAFRSEIRGWLEANLPWEYGKGLPPRFADLNEEVDFGREWQAKLAGAGWVGVTWPTEYGGRGFGPAQHFIVQEELARARAPEMVGRIGINLAGPTIMAHGTPAQKERWLARILRADDLWCQLFSEPGAGSDLASLTTKATPVDGGWRLNGQKVWTSYAQFASWGVCLARTDPAAQKRDGISYLAVDMVSPGVDVRPLRQLTGECEFNEVYFTDVFVPKEQLVGPENEGWRVANSTLSHERGINPRQLVIHIQLLEELLQLAETNGSFDDERLARRLADAYTEVRLFQLHNWRSVSRLEKGESPGPEGSALKLYWS